MLWDRVATKDQQQNLQRSLLQLILPITVFSILTYNLVIEKFSIILPALLAQFLHDPFDGRPALAAVVRHGVDDDALHVTGEGNPLHGHNHFLV